MSQKVTSLSFPIAFKLISFYIKILSNCCKYFTRRFSANLQPISTFNPEKIKKYINWTNKIPKCKNVQLIKRKPNFEFITKPSVKPLLFSRFSISQNLHRCAHKILNPVFLLLQRRFSGSPAVAARTLNCPETPEKVAKSCLGHVSLRTHNKPL